MMEPQKEKSGAKAPGSAVGPAAAEPVPGGPGVELKRIREILKKRYPEEDEGFAVFESNYLCVYINISDVNTCIKIYETSWCSETDYFINFNFDTSKFSISVWHSGVKREWKDLIEVDMPPNEMLMLLESILGLPVGMPAPKIEETLDEMRKAMRSIVRKFLFDLIYCVTWR